MNSITDLLDLEDANVIISDIQTQGQTKTITLETPPAAHFCPSCGFRMHSRGIKNRTITHPILQDNYSLILILKQRRWRCTNPECRYDISESFKFVNKPRRTTNATDMLIVDAYRNLLETSASIAKRFHVSDSHAHEVFDRYVKLDRLPLTDAISIDEVHLDMDNDCRYALVIQDFHTGDPIDLLRSRRTNITEPYFVSIPSEERNQVKYLISDMYNPYIAYVEKYFPNAVPVVDSFHVIQWITRSIENYIRQLIKKYRQRDREYQDNLSFEQQRPITLPPSDEVYLLQKYRWLILANQSNIRYRNDPRMDAHFHALMNTYDYEDALFRIDSNLRDFRDLKEKYVQFNSRNGGNPIQARAEIKVLIQEFRESHYEIFRDFASLLEKYEDPIINSFIMVEKIGNGKIYDARLFNGPIESINRKVKDLKRLGRGFRNFEHFRNKFLYFEIEQEDELRRYGKSKEHRPNPIVTMGMFMDADGIPLAFDIFPGNRNEQTTLKPLESKVIKDFDCSEFVFCSDAGLCSKSNRRFNSFGNRSYVITQSLKKMRGEDRQTALNPKQFRRLGSDKFIDMTRKKTQG